MEGDRRGRGGLTEDQEIGGGVPLSDRGTEDHQGCRKGKKRGERRHDKISGCLLPELKACWRTS